MKHEIIATGATVDEARAKAIAELNAPSDADVHIEVVALPVKKVLGLFGGSPAKVKASYESADVKPAQEPKPAAPKAKPENKAPNKANKAEKPAKAAPVKKEAPVVAPAPKAEVKAEASEEEVEIDIETNKVAKVAVEYLKGILKNMDIADFDVKVCTVEKTGEIIINIACEDDYGILIGRRGETLDALQILTRLAAKKGSADSDYSRVSVNIGNYREKRNITLKELAKKNASKVLKYGRNMTFEPMNPYERRVIHTTVQEIEGVVSFSVGSDAQRKVVIALADGVKPTHARTGGSGYNKGGYKGNNPRNNNNRRPYNNNSNSRPRTNNPRPAQTTDLAPTREPRTDASAQSVARYGKIN